MKPQITYDDFSKLDLRVGEVLEASEVEKSTKLLHLKVDFGPEIGLKTIFSGIKQWYTPESLKGKKFIFVINLAPRTFKIGDQELVSEGMIVAADNNEAILYSFDKDLPNGSLVK